MAVHNNMLGCFAKKVHDIMGFFELVKTVSVVNMKAVGAVVVDVHGNLDDCIACDLGKAP